jgi:DNA repair photolyase
MGGLFMGLNKSTGNMFNFVSHTWNTVKGACFHDCHYCYMKKWGVLRPAHFDLKELKTDLGENNFIFIGSSIDLFGANIEHLWRVQTFQKASAYNNKYLLQTKNPFEYHAYLNYLPPEKYILSTTLETNRQYFEMGNSPAPKSRAIAMKNISREYRLMVTIEPIMLFDLKPFSEMILSFNPEQINIGADSGGHGLTEPSARLINQLIDCLNQHSKVVIKPNLKRIMEAE